mmetsp:Transcript_40775/g.72436  ORF Transcript_40775/g.72436 Transcript_40775/m.72436 type:complete len:84 (-) Transcript_40775:534-785(-)
MLDAVHTYKYPGNIKGRKTTMSTNHNTNNGKEVSKKKHTTILNIYVCFPHHKKKQNLCPVIADFFLATASSAATESLENIDDD